MDWKDYFAKTRGRGFMATTNSNNEVNIAMYSAPKIQDDGTLAFGMTDRLTHANVTETGKAVYAFSTEHYGGVRLYLEKTREEKEGALIEQIRQEADKYVHPGVGNLVKFVVYFNVTKHLPLIIEQCTGDHSKHLCEIAGNEQFDLIKELAKEPEFMCMNCGRLADDAKSLCNPLALQDISCR